VVGGSQIMDESGYFNIGKRDDMVLRKVFWMNNVLIHSQDIARNVNGTFSIEFSSGKVWIKTSGNGIKKI
jgi:chemotaxis protein CheD